MSDRELPALLAAASVVVSSAAEFLFSRYRQRNQIEVKADGSLLTAVDLAAEEILAQGLARIDGIPFVGEERGGSAGSGLYWCVDPLDGTSNFCRGIPLWGSSVALMQDGAPVAGIIALPCSHEVYSAVRGGGAVVNGTPFTAAPPVAGKPLLCLDCGSRDDDARRIGALREALVGSYSSRDLGCSVFQLTALARGHIDLLCTAGQGWWDIAAGIVIAAEAGMMVTNWSGGPVSVPDQMLGGRPELHRQFLDQLARLD